MRILVAVLVAVAVLVLPLVLWSLRHRLGQAGTSLATWWVAAAPVVALALALPAGGLAVGPAGVVTLVALVTAASGPARFVGALRTPVGEDGLDRVGWLSGQAAIAFGLIAPVVAAAALLARALGSMDDASAALVVVLTGALVPALAIVAGEVVLAGTGPLGRVGGLAGLLVGAGCLVVGGIDVIENTQTSRWGVGVAGLVAALLAISLRREAAPRAVEVTGPANLSTAAVISAVLGFVGAAVVLASGVGGALVTTLACGWLARSWGLAVAESPRSTPHTHDENGCCSRDHAEPSTS